MPSPLREALLQFGQLHKDLIGTVHDPPTDPGHWDAEAEGLDSRRTPYNSRSLSLLFILRLEQNPADFPPRHNPVLQRAFKDIDTPLFGPLAAPLLPLLDAMPAGRGDALRNTLLKRGALLALSSGSTAHLGPLLDDCANMVEDLFSDLTADPTLAATGFKIDGFAFGEFFATDILALRRALKRPFPDNLPDILNHELPMILALNPIDVRCKRPALRRALEAIPEQTRTALLRAQTHPPWHFIDLVPEPDFATETLRAAFATTQPYEIQHGLEAAPQIDWLPQLATLWPEAQAQPSHMWALWFSKHLKQAALKSPMETVLSVLAHANIEAQHHLIIPIAKRLAEEGQPTLETLFPTAPPQARVALARLLTLHSASDGDTGPLQRRLAQETDPTVQFALQAGLDRLDPDWPDLCARLDDWLAGTDLFDNPVRNAELAWARDVILQGTWHRNFDHVLVYDPLLTLALREKPSNIEHMHAHELPRLSKTSPQLRLQAILAALLHRPLKHHRDDFTRLAPQLSLAHHLRAFKEGSPAMQRLATSFLSKLGEPILPSVLPMLEARKAADRTAAARLLELVASPNAIAPLQTALSKEKAAKAAAALKSALSACSQVQSTIPTATSARCRLHAPFTTSAGLEHLRAVLYAPPTAISWVELCHVLERFKIAGTLDMALDYLGAHDLDRWPEDLRCQPWGWTHDPSLAAIGDPLAGPKHWATVAALAHPPSRDAFIKAGQDMFEAKARTRTLPTHMIPELLRWIEAAWGWIERQNLDLEDLAVRLDGGAKRGMGRPQSTSLTLHQGFGLAFARDKAFGGEVPRMSVPEMRWVRVKLPSDHLLFDKHPQAARRPHLDLMKVLEIQARAAGEGQP